MSTEEIKQTLGVLLQRVEALRIEVMLLQRDSSERHAALLKTLAADEAPH
jgi:hypothetical protein